MMQSLLAKERVHVICAALMERHRERQSAKYSGKSAHDRKTERKRRAKKRKKVTQVLEGVEREAHRSRSRHSSTCHSRGWREQREGHRRASVQTQK